MRRIFQPNDDELFTLRNSNGPAASVSSDAAVSAQMTFPKDKPQRFFPRLLGNARALNMLMLIAMLVGLLHGYGLFWLEHIKQSNKSPTPKPLEMQIIPVSISKPKLAPPPSLSHSPAPKLLQPKPILKNLPMVQLPADFAPIDQASPSATVEASPTAATTDNNHSQAVMLSEMDIEVNYADNPKPDYPAIARSRGWQGKVLLKVQVSEEGASSVVEIERSSGYDILDESATEAVKSWRFTPARRGDTQISSTVIVPIIFILHDQEFS